MASTIPGVCKPTEANYFFLAWKNKWFGAQGSSGSYFCNGIGMSRLHGAFSKVFYRFSDSLSQERLISREQEGNPGLFLEC